MGSSSNWLDDVFGVPADGSNVESAEDEAQDNAYTEIGKSTKTESYEEKSAAINKQIAPETSSDVVEYVDVIEQEVKQPTTKVEVVKEETRTPIAEQQETVEPEIFESTEDQGSIVDTEPEGTAENPPPTGVSDNLSDDWYLTCTTAKLKSFYAHKSAKVQRLKKIGFIPFDKYLAELKNAHVSIWNPTDDTSIVNSKIKEIADWRNRVTQITLEVDPQLAWWGMVVEGLQGLLALTQYEKPKERQTGMHYLHLRDVEYYLASLKGLKANCVSVMSNLDKAYDSLSRQITVIMPQREIERYAQPSHPPQQPKPQPPTPRPPKVDAPPFDPSPKAEGPSDDFLSDFDKISDDHASVKASSTTAKTPIKKETSMKKSWDDIGTKKR